MPPKSKLPVEAIYVCPHNGERVPCPLCNNYPCLHRRVEYRPRGADIPRCDTHDCDLVPGHDNLVTHG